MEIVGSGGRRAIRRVRNGSTQGPLSIRFNEWPGQFPVGAKFERLGGQSRLLMCRVERGL
jgi:hypothetical protein